jgi:hypothetical protein
MTADDEKQLQDLEGRYRANLSAAAAALAAARREPWVVGSTGQRKAHPGFVVAARCDELVLRYAQELEEMRKRLERDDSVDPFAELDRVAVEWPKSRAESEPTQNARRG